jgi:outer membrane protein OmpA-like peptidoglycan-associated protein
MSLAKSMFVIAAFTGSLLGCVQPMLNDARNAPTASSAFFQHLQSGYLKLAEDEYREDDWVDTRHFAKRSSAAAAGQNIGPQDITARNLPKDKIAEISEARSRLLVALKSGTQLKAPTEAAEAQVMFDCWMQEQEENFQPEDIRKCREGFTTALSALEGALKPVVRAPLKLPPVAAKPEPLKFVLYFGFDKGGNNRRIKENIIKVINAVKVFNPVRIQIAGHTDRAGREAYNLKLSEQRATTVAKMLIDAGLPSTLLNINGFGESGPAVFTQDGKRLRANRRVEITLMK